MMDLVKKVLWAVTLLFRALEWVVGVVLQLVWAVLRRYEFVVPLSLAFFAFTVWEHPGNAIYWFAPMALLIIPPGVLFPYFLLAGFFGVRQQVLKPLYLQLLALFFLEMALNAVGSDLGIERHHITWEQVFDGMFTVEGGFEAFCALSLVPGVMSLTAFLWLRWGRFHPYWTEQELKSAAEFQEEMKRIR